MFELIDSYFSFRGNPSADPSGILPRNPSADPSAESFRGSFRGSFRDPFRDPSVESFRGVLPRKSFRDPSGILPWSPSADPSADLLPRILPQILPRNPSADPSADFLPRALLKKKIVYELTFTGSFRGSFREILPRASFRESIFSGRNPSAESFRKILPRILPRF